MHDRCFFLSFYRKYNKARHENIYLNIKRERERKNDRHTHMHTQKFGQKPKQKQRKISNVIKKNFVCTSNGSWATKCAYTRQPNRSSHCNKHRTFNFCSFPSVSLALLRSTSAQSEWHFTWFAANVLGLGCFGQVCLLFFSLSLYFVVFIQTVRKWQQESKWR